MVPPGQTNWDREGTLVEHGETQWNTTPKQNWELEHNPMSNYKIDCDLGRISPATKEMTFFLPEKNETYLLFPPSSTIMLSLAWPGH